MQYKITPASRKQQINKPQSTSFDHCISSTFADSSMADKDRSLVSKQKKATTPDENLDGKTSLEYKGGVAGAFHHEDERPPRKAERSIPQ